MTYEYLQDPLHVTERDIGQQGLSLALEGKIYF
jgi:hypothetical protein